MKKGFIGFVALLVWCSFLGVTAAGGLTPEEKCEFKLMKEKEKYEKCVTKWLGKVYANKLSRDSNETPPKAQEQLAKCRVKYGKVWDKLQRLGDTTACYGDRFVDNGATVFDRLTGLTWEKKDSADDVDSFCPGGPTCGNVHDADNLYTWTDGLDPDDDNEDGSAFTEFLVTLNNGAFDGSAGWRLPTFAELQTILLPEPYSCSTAPAPCIDPVFDDANTAVNYHLSSTSFVPTYEQIPGTPPRYGPEFVWTVAFNSSNAAFNFKVSSYSVRAVRGGH